MFASLIASILVLFGWIFAHSVSGAIAFVVLFGAVSGAVIGLPPASIANILGYCPSQQSKLGQWTGMMYTGTAIFALTGPIIAGSLITQFKNYLTIQLWSGICLFLCFFCMAMAKWYAREQVEEAEFRGQ